MLRFPKRFLIGDVFPLVRFPVFMVSVAVRFLFSGFSRVPPLFSFSLQVFHSGRVYYYGGFFLGKISLVEFSVVFSLW